MTRDELINIIFNDNTEASCPSDCLIIQHEHYSCTECARAQLSLYEIELIRDVFTILKEYRVEMIQDIIMSDDAEYIHNMIMNRREKL